MRHRRDAFRLSAWREDDGMSLVMVVGFSAVLAGLMALTGLTAVRSLRSSSDHVKFESSLAAAEAGVDAELANATKAGAAATYVTPATCNVDTPPVASDFASADAERAWAIRELTELAERSVSLGLGCLKSSSEGQFLAVRPAGKQAVYSMGWYPAYGPASKRRLVKAEYLFAPYKPNKAVLTGGDLDFSGSVAIVADSGAGADVHTNSDITGYDNSLNVDGAITASGTLPGACPSGVDGGCEDGQAEIALPEIDARSIYPQRLKDPNFWWDLCPDGTVRTPAPDTATAKPCDGTVVGGSGFRGWRFTDGDDVSTAPVWTLPRTAGGPFAGTYYVYQGDARIGDNGHSAVLWPITVIAEAKTSGVTPNATTCNKLGGNVTWKLFSLTPRLPGLQLLADANLYGTANTDAGSGLFLAGDKVDINTSSGQIRGAVIAGNYCAAQGANSIQGMEITYDDEIESALADIIRTALWLEYPAG